jgi:HK97 family phage major capsid protein
METNGTTSELQEEVRSLRATIDGLLGGEHSPRVQILKEPMTYEAHLVKDRYSRTFRAVNSQENRSYVQDFCLAQLRGDNQAKERLQRHEQEMRKIGEARQRIFHPDVEYEFEERASNWTNGTGGYFAPPLWIIEQFAYQPTPERVLAKLAPQFELPPGVQSVNIPSWTAGAEVGPQALGAAAANTATTDAAQSSAVVTIAGNYDVPMQMLEQSPQGAHLDWIAFTTMEARYGYQLELQLINGTGAAVPQGSGNNQLLGIYNNTAIPTANVITFTNGGSVVEQPASVSGANAQGATAMFPFLGLMSAKIGQARLLPPEAWMMSTSRAAWLGSSEDLQSRPLVLSDNTDGPGQWDLLSFPVWLNDAIPRNSGPSALEERIICLRPSDWLLLESERRTSVEALKRSNIAARGRDNAGLGDAMGDALSGSLMVRLQLRRYAAAVLRYPTSVSYIGGTGMQINGGW